MAALQDVRVLDLSRLLPGPFCTQLLADLGADVIKIEDTDRGDYLRWMPPLAGSYSALFHAVNHNKRSVVLNLKNEGARRVFLRLVESADVVVEGFRPGVMERLQLGWDTLHARNPRLVLCSITGYGQDGPYRSRVGHDINYAALAGVLSTTGSRDGTPVVPGVQMGDLGGGALGAAVAVLAALYERDRTGEGRHCDVAMLDGLLSWMAPAAAAYEQTGEVPRPATALLNGRYPCYRIYRCADGYLALGALEPKFWRNFVVAIGMPELADAGLASGAEADSAAAAVEQALLRKSRAAWMQELGDAEVCCEPVLGVDEVLEHPQVKARAAGATPVQRGVVSPFRLLGVTPPAQRPAPGYGEHTRDVLAEAGVDASAFETLVREGATITAS